MAADSSILYPNVGSEDELLLLPDDAEKGSFASCRSGWRVEKARCGTVLAVILLQAGLRQAYRLVFMFNSCLENMVAKNQLNLLRKLANNSNYLVAAIAACARPPGISSEAQEKLNE